MLLQYSYLPKAILEVLRPKLPQSAAPVIARPNRRREQNLRTQLPQTIIVFIVLTTHHLFIQLAGALNNSPRVGPKRHSLHIASVTGSAAKGNSTDAKTRTHRKRYCRSLRRIRHSL